MVRARSAVISLLSRFPSPLLSVLRVGTSLNRLWTYGRSSGWPLLPISLRGDSGTFTSDSQFQIPEGVVYRSFVLSLFIWWAPALMAQDPFEIHIYEYESVNGQYSLEAHLNALAQGNPAADGTLLPTEHQT